MEKEIENKKNPAVNSELAKPMPIVKPNVVKPLPLQKPSPIVKPNSITRPIIQPKPAVMQKPAPLSIQPIKKDSPQTPVQKPIAIKKDSPQTPVQKPIAIKKDEAVDLSKNVTEVIKPKDLGKLIESYHLEVDGADVLVEIRKSDMGYSFNLFIPQLDVATATLLGDLRNELISVTTVSMKELTDPTAFKTIKERFLQDARRLLHEKLPKTDPEVERFLIGKLIQDMLGLGEIEFLVADASLEEIIIPSAKEPIRVYSKKYGWVETNIKIQREEDTVNYANIIARRVGRQITVLSPLLDAHLVTGDRINAVLYPIDTKGNTITIRKFARDPYTIIDFIKNKTCDLDTASLIWLAVEFEMNVLISGGTGSGKTSFLNACMPFIPPNQRIISIEDTRELMLPEFLFWAPLVTRTANAEGKGEVSMLDLLVNSLRMRPDRIILGEMRRKEEAMVLFEAMHTGHSVYATVHADSAPETISRLVNPPLSVPPNLLKSVNLNVVMFRDRRRGIRRILQIAEFEAASDRAEANIIYRWAADQDKLVKHNESTRFYEDIARHTGMNSDEANKDLAEKKKILQWFLDHNIRDLESFGKVLNLYYRNKPFLLDEMKKNN
jgi:archaeal flagellar protein FlaI